MQLTKFSDFALRILIHLAVAGEDRLSARGIAEQQGESVNHMAKIAQWLAAEGYVAATRGRGGGMVLARPAEDISIGQVLRRSEAGSPLVECMHEDGGHCVLTPACGLLPYLGTAQEAFFAALDAVTLKDVIEQKSGMIALVRALNRQREGAGESGGQALRQ